LRIIFLFILCVGVSSCVSYDGTDDEVAKDLVGTCYEFKENVVLSEYWGWGTNFLVQQAGANECTPRHSLSEFTKEDLGLFDLPKCSWIPIGVLEERTKFEVIKVIDASDGSNGRCWTLDGKITSGKYAGIIVSIPACHWNWTYTPVWLVMESKYEYQLPLEIDDKYAQQCKRT